MSRFKYNAQLELCADQPCPHPAKFQGRKTTGYRWVREPVSEDDFIPQAIRIGRTARCSGWALSFFKSAKAARKKWIALIERMDTTSLGTHIAEIDLEPSDGICSKPNKDGHFEIHEYETGRNLQHFIKSTQSIAQDDHRKHVPSITPGDSASKAQLHHDGGGVDAT